jgi:hypothetical protein
MICSIQDLYNNTQVTQNAGITQDQIDNYEILVLLKVFGHKKGEELIEYIQTHTACAAVPPSPLPSDNPFGGTLNEPVNVCDYGELTPLVNGVGGFIGLKKILCFYIALFTTSSGNSMLGRANTDWRGAHASSEFARGKMELVNMLSLQIYMASLKMSWWLKKSENNPLNLCVHYSAQPTPSSTNTSGRRSMFNGWFY